MINEKALLILKKTKKPIYYKKGRHAIPKLIEDRKQAIDLFFATDDEGGVMEYEDHVEIWDYDEIDWLC